jgi:hypothetical protein
MNDSTNYQARGILDLSQLGDIGQDADRPSDGGPPSSFHWLQAALALSMGVRPSALPTPVAAASTFPSALPRSSWDASSPSLWHPPFGANAAQPISDDPFARAAFRTRQSVQPDGGCLEGATTSVLENYLPHVANQLQTLPQRAFEASERSRLTGEYDPGPAVETALMMLGLRGVPAIAHRPGSTRRASEHSGDATNPMVSKSASLYNFPVKPQRPFELDYPPNRYPHGAPADATGRLTHDIEGRPLVAERVVGRRLLGGADEALSPAEINTVGTQLTGRAPEVVAGREIGGNAGLFTVRPDAAGNADVQHPRKSRTFADIEK